MEREAQHLAIAEACGWTYHKQETHPKRKPTQYEYVLQAPDDEIKVLPEFTAFHADYESDTVLGLKRLPDYTRDLNAMHEASVNHLSADQTKRYHESIKVIIQRDNGASELESEFLCIDATASQRAEAFLRTINKWAA